MYKWATIILIILLLLTNGAWVLAAVDLMVSEKYRQQVEYESLKTIDSLLKINSHLVNGFDKTQLNNILVNVFPDSTPYEKHGYLNAPWISFKIEKDDTIGRVVTQGQVIDEISAQNGQN